MSSTRPETLVHDIRHAHAPELTIRRLARGDRDAVGRLAALDSSRIPAGPLLGAEVEGRLLAAISTASGELVADPFHRTSEVAEMLRLRASMLAAGARGTRRSLRSLLRGGAVRRRASLSPAPPGSGRRLLADQVGCR